MRWKTPEGDYLPRVAVEPFRNFRTPWTTEFIRKLAAQRRSGKKVVVPRPRRPQISNVAPKFYSRPIPRKIIPAYDLVRLIKPHAFASRP